MESTAKTLNINDAFAAKIEAMVGSGGFRVVKLGRRVLVHGAVHATTDISALQVILSDENIIDFRGLLAICWRGAQTLRDFLQTTPLHLVLIGMPQNLYRYLRFMPITNPRVQLAEAEMQVFDPRDPEVPCYNVMIRLEYLRQLSTSPGSAINLGPGEQILGLNIAPPLASQMRAADPHPAYAHRWCQQNQAETTFFLRLGYLVHDLGNAFFDQMLSTYLAMAASQNAVLFHLETINRVTTFLQMPGRQHLIDQMQTIFLDLKQDLLTMLRRFADDRSHASRALQYLQNSCFLSDQTMPQGLYHGISLLTAKVSCQFKSLREKHYLQRLEECGERVLGAAGLVSTLHHLPEASRKGPLAEKLTSAFQIMDPMTEDNWEANVREIAAIESTMISELLAVRLHLMHGEQTCSRHAALLNEVALIADQMRAPDMIKGGKWQQLHDALLKVWTQRDWIADDERKIYEYYFPEIVNASAPSTP